MPVTLHGVSRNQTALCYVVRFSIWGKQIFVGNAITQQAAGRLYDLALWKFLPKMPRMKASNFPDDFAFITQRRIDEEAPRLNDLYASFPFQSPADATVDEDTLRESLMDGSRTPNVIPSRNLTSYNNALHKLKRLRLLLEGNNKLDDVRLSMPHVHKLPSVTDGFTASAATFALLIEQLRATEASMEAQRAYYQKIATEDEAL